MERFLRLPPPVFKGDPDLKATEEWVQEVSMLFKEMEALDVQRITLITYILRGATDHWWSMVAHTEDIRAMTWVQIISIFMNQFFPQTE